MRADGFGYTDASRHPARRSAEVIVDLLLQDLEVTSVLDVGCGIGIWLKELADRGVADFMGVDGPWVPAENLLIDPRRFRVHDLETPLELGRVFDLVLCLEVAEHLSPAAADVLVNSLVAHAPIVCFSAAVPGQGGFRHTNEQYQDHWIEKFEARGLRAYDPWRSKLWTAPGVEFYYAQNLLLFSRERLPFSTEFIPTPIHPKLYSLRTDPRNYSLKDVVPNLPHYLARGLGARFRRLLPRRAGGSREGK